VLDDSLSVNKLLGDETSGGEHGKTSVLELLGLHDGELLWVLWLEAKWIETDVTWSVVLTHESSLVDWDGLWLNESHLGTSGLGGADSNSEEDPEEGWHLGEVGDAWSTDLGIEEEGRSLNLLSDEESNDGEHGDASVGELGLAVTLEGVGIGLLGESEWIEESDWGDGAWELGGGLEGGSGGGLLDWSEGGGGTGEGSDEGGGELHGCCWVWFVVCGLWVGLIECWSSC